MKKLLKVAIGGVVIILLGCAGLYGWGSTLDPHHELDAERAMEATVAQLQPQLHTYDGVVDWWTLAAEDFPGGDGWVIAHTDGPEDDVGLELEFQVAGTTAETWTLLSSAPGEVVWHVDFGVFQVTRTFTLVDEGDGSTMTWHDAADFQHPLARLLTLSDGASQINNFQMAMRALDESALD